MRAIWFSDRNFRFLSHNGKHPWSWGGQEKKKNKQNKKTNKNNNKGYSSNPLETFRF